MGDTLRRVANYCLLLILTVAAPAAIPMGGPVPPHLDGIPGISPAPSAFPHALLSPESLLVSSLLDIRNARLHEALRTINTLLKISPHFKLAHLIKGDLLLAQTKAISTLGNVPNAPVQRLDGLRDEARVRLQRYLEKPPVNLIPRYLLQLEPEQKYAVVIDTSKSRLYLFRNQDGVPRYVTDYYITSGKNGADKTKEGDKRTPVGVYFVTSSLSKRQLSDFYGPEAFPINYPNVWDKRLGRSGHGIWLHGTPSDTYSRPPRASSGCVALANPDLDALGKVLQIGLTPVVISDGIDWISERKWRLQRQTLERQLEDWRRDWVSRDNARYLSHYGPDFLSAGKLDFAQWAKKKQRINQHKSWIKVNLSRISIFGYPGKANMAVVTFDQNYQSNNLDNRMRKRQYWKLENHHWKIVYEGPVG